MDELDAALLYLSYVIRRSGESADDMRRKLGPSAVALEARYQADLEQAREANALDYFSNLEGCE